MTENVNVVLLNMEYGIHEQVTRNHDDSFTVFLNARDTFEMQMQSYVHAIKGHIANDDHYKLDVQEVEYRSHKEKI